ncbi:MAG: hypothetical protein K2I49_01035, partial [Ureaplasma sp.]|nr:hypothetical protein [Ureaplasma sp.]
EIKDSILNEWNDDDFSSIFGNKINKKNYKELKLLLNNFNGKDKDFEELKSFIKEHYKKFKREE